jgi:multidrug transporter EmrE-like cation transporter
MTSTPAWAIALVIAASVVGSFGAVFLKLGAAHLHGGMKHLFNWQLITGIALYLGSSIPYTIGLKHGELSVLYPMVSAGYICTLLWSRIFFKEPITGAKIGALGLILAGLICISTGGRG